MSSLFRIRTNIYRRKLRGGGERWIVRWRSPSTMRWVTMTGGRTKDEAMLVEARIRQVLARGEDPEIRPISPVKDISVGALIDRFYQHSRYMQGTALWREESRTRLEKYVRPAFGDTEFGRLVPEHFYKFYLSLKDRGLGRPTICKTHTLMGFLGDVYVEMRPEAKNTARILKDFGRYFPKRAPLREINFLTEKELDALFRETRQSKSPLLSPLVEFLALTGLRRGEAYALKWTDIDFVGGFIRVRQSKNGQARSVPLEQGAIDALNRLQKDTPFVFCLADGSRPHPSSFRKPLRTAAKRAGIVKRIDLHTFRHSYGSNKIRQGFGLKKVSMLLGHADITMTSKVYAHLLDGDLRVRDEHRTHATPIAALSTTNGIEQTVNALLTEMVTLSGFTLEQLREIVAAAANGGERQ